MLRRTKDSRAMRRMLETRSHTWQAAGLALQIDANAARKARRQAAILIPLLAGVLIAYEYRDRLFGIDMPIRVITVVALVGLGWTLARDIGRAAGPALFRRLDPGTAGTVGFLIRLVTMGVTLLVALNIAGLPPRTIAVGGAFTAVIFGLAAQQTLGNLIAGTVLLSARPFRVGDRVRMQGGGLAGTVEGVVSSLGLLYTTLASGEDSIMVPNSVVLSSAVTPLREPDAVDLRARLRSDVKPSDLQDLLERSVTVDVRSDPRIFLEELDGDEVVVRVAATPARASDGPQLADEVLAAVAACTRDGTGTGADDRLRNGGP
ncbi:MAG TPA: mechanosensitive ion channel family protein [Solirubrobacteraceae bacterium]|nr:mechanosensitive ion channel family protein [Solirubrobacteraceae bacterium]